MGRHRFSELCFFYKGTNDVFSQENFERSLNYSYNVLSPNEGHFLRKSLTHDAGQNFDKLSSNSVNILLPHLPQITSFGDELVIEKIARRLWKIDPNYFFDPDIPTLIHSKFESIVSRLKPKNVFQDLGENTNLLKKAIGARPKLLASHYLWNGSYDDIAIEALRASSIAAIKTGALLAIVQNNREDLVTACITILGPQFILKSLLNSRNLKNKAVEASFLSKTISSDNIDQSILLELLVGDLRSLPKWLLFEFMKRISPNLSVPTGHGGHDIWVDLWQSSTGDLASSQMMDPMVFMAVRAFSVPDSNAASLLSIAFDPLYDKISQYSLGYSLWKTLDEYLLPSGLMDWSKTSQLIRSVALLAIRKKFNPDEFLSLSKNKWLLSMITQTINDTWEGKQYLKGLKKAASKPVWEQIRAL